MSFAFTAAAQQPPRPSAPAARAVPAPPAGPSISKTSETAEGGITLNFVNADVRDVAKSVLGDYLKLNYEIGSNVQGTVTLQTSQPLKHEQVLPALEQALSLNNMALVRSHGIYEIMPLTDAHKNVGLTPGRSRNSLGYGVEVVHVKYIGAEQMQKLLAPLVSEGTIRVDPTRNLLIIEGTAQERQALIEDVALFDTDSMAGMSFELFQPENMDADELAKELDALIGGTTGPMAGVVRLVPIDRLNAVLAITPQPRYIAQLRAWVAKLDRPGQGNDKKIYVYHVQNGRATDLGNTLLKTLFGPGASVQTTGATPQNSSDINSFGSGSSSLLNSFGGGSSGMTSTTSLTGTQSGGTAPSHPTASPSTNFQAVTTPQEGGGGHEGKSRPFETVNGVSREGINSVNITADETNNALVILATPREYKVIEDALRQLDVAPIQVLLEASIAEVTLTNQTQYGIQYFFGNSHNQAVLTQSSTFPAVPPTTTTGPTGIPTTIPGTALASSFPGFAYSFINGNSIQVILNALAQITHVQVISSPEVMVLNNQMASLEVGDQVPILSGESQSAIGDNSPVLNSVEYLDTGVILKVTPRVNRSGQVMMDISQEVSGVDSTVASSIGSPTIQQRKIESSVSVGDGQTVALGGLFSDQTSSGHNGIPFLQDIPLLGNLFRSTDNSHNRTELMVLITPHVVDNPEKAIAVTNELRRKLPEVQPLFDKHG